MRDLYSCEVCGFLSTKRSAYEREAQPEPGTKPRLLCGSCALTINHNVASIHEVPRDVLPDGDARDALMKLARSGQDVYAYHAGSGDEGVWNLWLESRANATAPVRNGRVTVVDWYEEWCAYAEWCATPEAPEPESATAAVNPA